MTPAVRAAEPSRDGARDHLGRQIVQKLAATGKSIHSVFDLDGRRIAEYERDPVAGTSTLLREYIWLGDEPVAVVEGGTLYFVRADHIGRPGFATDAAGSVVWSLAYLPFGKVHVSTGSPIDARFPGQWYQAESGLYQNWMRDYDPSTGRYLEPDPLGLVDGASVYGYALQNPGRWTDPTGQCPPCGVVWAVITWTGGAAGTGSGASWVGVGIGAAILGAGAATPAGVGSDSPRTVDEAKQCSPDECQKIYLEIDSAVAELRQRFRQWSKNRGDYAPGDKGWYGTLPKFGRNSGISRS